MKYGILLLLNCIVGYYSTSQTCNRLEYKFLDKFENADLNYNSIDSINYKSGGISLLDSVFNVVKGHYTIYRFMTYDRGVLFDEHESDLNNLIILKIDSANRIIDGFQYFLQNPEMPLSCYLYRLSKKRYVKPRIKIAGLKFKRVHKVDNEYFTCSLAPIYLKENSYVIFGN
jgi:hypothetical protein